MSGGKLLNAALAYAAQGWPVFPLHWPCNDDGVAYCSCGDPDCRRIGEHPNLLLVPDGCRNATADREMIEWWWGGGPHNIGIPIGAETGIVVIDIDPVSGGDVALLELIRQYGPLPATARFLASGGRQQLIFAHPRRPIQGASKRIAAGIEVLGDGDYLVGPPSVSAEGQRYIWSLPPDPHRVLIAPLPLWLTTLICKPLQRFPIPPEFPEALRWLDLGGALGHRRNLGVAWLSELLLSSGIDPYWALDLARAWNAAHCKPPLPDTEVVGLVEDAFEQLPKQQRREILQRSAEQFGETPRWPQALFGGEIASRPGPQNDPAPNAISKIPSMLATASAERDLDEASQGDDAAKDTFPWDARS